MELERYLTYLLEEDETEEYSEEEDELEDEEDEGSEIKDEGDMEPNFDTDDSNSSDDDLGGEEDENEDPDETIEDKIDRQNKYKEFENVKDQFFKLETLVSQYRYNDPKLLNDVEKLRWEFDSFTEFYDKMNNEEREERSKKVNKMFIDLLKSIKK